MKNTVQDPANRSGRVVACQAGSGSAPRLSYHGGPVLGSVEVVPIYWGSAWASAGNAKLATGLDNFIDFFLGSALVDLLSEYGTSQTSIRRGRRLASVYVSENEPGTMRPAGRQVTDDEVQSELLAWISSHKVPPRTANTLYFIFLPPAVSSIGFFMQPCVGGVFYGYHANLGNLYYAVAPFMDDSKSVFPGTVFDTFTAAISRELCAAITNPALDGWWDEANDEICEACNHQTVRLGGYLLHLAWSNAQGTCAFQPATEAVHSDKAQVGSAASGLKYSRFPAGSRQRVKVAGNALQAT